MKNKQVFEIDKIVKTSDVLGVFDKNEDDEYIIIVDGEEYEFLEYADKFLGGTIEIHSKELE